MRKVGLLMLLGILPAWAGEMPEKAADYHAALMKRPESAALFDRFRDAWLEERSVEELEKELLARAEAKEPGAWSMLGRAWLAAGKTEQALEAFDKARKQAPSAWLDLELAKLRMAAKDFAAAEKDALSVPEGDAQRLEALKLAGLACLRAERIDDALVHWTKAVAAAPGDIGLLEDLTELTRREGRIELALDYCGKWRDATVDAYGKAMATLRRSELLLGSQRFDEAMTELAAVLEVSADDSWLEREALSRAEQAHRQRGNSTGWAAWIGARAEANPARLSFRRTSAQALAAAGKVDEALDVLTEVMKRSPGDLSVRWQRISLLEQSMKLTQAYEECRELAAKEKTEAAGLRLAELAFRLEKKDEIKRALDEVIAAAEPAKRVGLAGLYARYGLPESSERIWREQANGEQGAQALRMLAKHLQTAGRDKEAIESWKKLGARPIALDRMEAAQMLAAAGERVAARGILLEGRDKLSAEPGYEAALADLAMNEEKADEARAIYLKLARTAKRPDELTAAAKGWLRTSATTADPVKELGDETADRCLRAAWLASKGQPLPAIQGDDELERPVRQALLRELGRWAEVVAMMEARGGDRGPLFLSELAEAKLAAGDLTGALTVAQNWRTRVPDQTSPWLFEAGVLEKLGKLPEATTLLRRALARFEDNEEVARRLFATLQQAVDPRESLEFAWKRHDRSPDESVRSGWLRQILEVSKQREQLDELQARFEERARRDPASPSPLMALAELAKARGDSRAELDFLRRAATNAPRDAAVISALATLEERSGETARAMERHVTLARLAPGPDSARNLAQAKIRLGDIEGGMRDMQVLAGEKGIDLRALEQSAGDLASRGYVEEAIRLLSAVEPSQRTARLELVRGMLLDADGREVEAVDAFIRVMAEPEDPAEAQQRASYGYGPNLRQVSPVLQSNYGREPSMPGVFTGLQVPRTQFEAQMMVKNILSRSAMERGGEVWSKACQAVPELALATPEQWREVLAFSKARRESGNVRWMEFIRSHPGNPLGIMLFVENNQVNEATPDEVEALLRTPLPLAVQMQLRWGRGEWRADNPDFMESIKPTDWQDEQVCTRALSMAYLMSTLAFQEGAQQKVSISDSSRVMAVLDKVVFKEAYASLMELLKARHSLLLGNTDDFLKHLAAWDESLRNRANLKWQQYGYGYGYGHGSPPIDAFESWRKKAGSPAAEALIEKISSPLLRCQLTTESKPGQRLARVKRELAALPKDAPVETRRGLIRMSWGLFQPKYQLHEEGARVVEGDLLKQLEAQVADESDPRMAFEAFIQLSQSRRNDQNAAKANAAKLKELAAKLAASPDPTDQQYAAQYTGNFSLRPQRSTPVVTRWGGSASFSGGNGNSSSRSMLPAIVAMEDREQALREATKLLESSARACAGRPEYLREIIESLTKSELLDPALARISLPPNTGLGRQVAMLTLLDACSKPDRARSLLEEITKSRPWETRWTVDLALRTPDLAEMKALLDRVAEREDFDNTLTSLLAPRNSENAKGQLAQFTRLADWAPQAKGQRGWMGKVLFLLVKGGGGLQPLIGKNAAQLECYRRFLGLVLADPKQAEFGFRVMQSTLAIETPEAIDDAARKVLLAGAYLTDAPLQFDRNNQREMELASLEHLILLASQKGDDSAFPKDFREQLKIVDPASAAWLDKLLAAKTVTELPDLANEKAKSSGWVTLARHEAAMLRAVSLPGRDAWLTSVFRENKIQSLSSNLSHVIRASLLDAQKKKALSERLFALLEAAAGPRKDWGKKVQLNQVSPTLSRLQPAADAILNTDSDTDPAMLLAVLDHFREARVSVSNPNFIISKMSASWKNQTRQQALDGLAELFGKKREAPFTFGVWQSQGYAGNKPTFIWFLPQLLQYVRSDSSSEELKKVKADPNASFLNLFAVSNSSGDEATRRRALLKAAPDLVKLPVEIRNAVIDQLAASMTEDDTSGLPAMVSARISENTATQRKQRIAQARSYLESMKSGSSGYSSRGQSYGSILGQVIGDDEALTAEILAEWRPLAEADKSGKAIEAFTEGLLSNSRSSLRNTLAILCLLDPLMKDVPLAPRNSNSSNPLAYIWSRLKPEDKMDPAFWKQVAALSPKFQARIWLVTIRYTGENLDLLADPKLVATLRDAVKGGEVTRTALEWMMESARVRRDSRAKIDGDKLLAFANALKSSGALASDLSILVSTNYRQLSRMEKPGSLMAETPGLLAGLKTLPAELSSQLLQGVQQLWDKVQSDRSRDGTRNGGRISEEELFAAVYPVETAALLKLALSGGIDLSKGYFDRNGVTKMVLALNDAELLELWIRVSGKVVTGDLSLIAALLEKDRVAEAVSMAPLAVHEWNFGHLLYFTKKLESLVAKLRADPSPQAFRLAVRFSLMSDSQNEDAPITKLKERRAKLMAEFEGFRKDLPINERAELCLLLGMNLRINRNVPALSDFASDQAAREFKAIYIKREISPISKLFLPAVCSRVFVGDFSGLDLLTSAIDSIPVARRGDDMLAYEVILPVYDCLLSYIAGLDAKLPPPSQESILACAKVLSACKSPEFRGAISHLVHVISTDADQLKAGLKRCGLEGVKPSIPADSIIKCDGDPVTLRGLFRQALLHPSASEVLLKALEFEQGYSVTATEFLLLLRDAKNRAKISPVVFLKWNRPTIPLEAEDIEALKLYANERRAEFDESQRIELDRMMERWQKGSDPRYLEQMRLQREKMKLREQQQRKRMMQTD